MAIWPDRVRILDEETEEFVDEFRLRHGGVTNRTHTPDYKRFFFVTDRMESVEVVEPAKSQVVDELKLSTPERKVRVLGLAAHPDGNLLYISTRSVQMEVDRFEAEEPEIILYDLDAHEVKKSLRLPHEAGTRPALCGQDFRLSFFNYVLRLLVRHQLTIFWSLYNDQLKI